MNNFREFLIHNITRLSDESEVAAIADLGKEYHRMNSLVDIGDETVKKGMELPLQVGETAGTLCDASLLK